MDSLEEDESVLRVVLSTIILIGSVLNIIYLAYGLAILPKLLMKGTTELEPFGLTDEVKGNIQQARDQIQIIR